MRERSSKSRRPDRTVSGMSSSKDGDRYFWFRNSRPKWAHWTDDEIRDYLEDKNE